MGEEPDLPPRCDKGRDEAEAQREHAPGGGPDPVVRPALLAPEPKVDEGQQGGEQGLEDEGAQLDGLTLHP